MVNDHFPAAIYFIFINLHVYFFFNFPLLELSLSLNEIFGKIFRNKGGEEAETYFSDLISTNGCLRVEDILSVKDEFSFLNIYIFFYKLIAFSSINLSTLGSVCDPNYKWSRFCSKCGFQFQGRVYRIRKSFLPMGHCRLPSFVVYCWFFQGFYIADGVVKPRMKIDHNSVIIKELPASITSEEVLKIFSDLSHCPKPTSARSDMYNTWFVGFSSEEDAKAAYALIKNLSYGGKVLRVRLKTESRGSA